MRAAALVSLATFVTTGLLPSHGIAQTRGRRILIVGSVRTVPSGSRFALGTRLGTFSVEASGARIALDGKAGKFADLRLGSSVTIFGTILPAADGARSTIQAARVHIGATTPGVPKGKGTGRARATSKKG